MQHVIVVWWKVILIVLETKKNYLKYPKTKAITLKWVQNLLHFFCKKLFTPPFWNLQEMTSIWAKEILPTENAVTYHYKSFIKGYYCLFISWYNVSKGKSYSLIKQYFHYNICCSQYIMCPGNFIKRLLTIYCTVYFSMLTAFEDIQDLFSDYIWSIVWKALSLSIFDKFRLIFHIHML